MLDAREAAIMTLRFGLDGGKPRTLEEIGRKFKVTRERVRQLETIALRRIRRQMNHRDRQYTSDEIDAEKRSRKRAQILREFFTEQVPSAAVRRRMT